MKLGKRKKGGFKQFNDMKAKSKDWGGGPELFSGVIVADMKMAAHSRSLWRVASHL